MSPLAKAAAATTGREAGSVRMLVKDGVWQVSVEDRPSGWQALPGVSEPHAGPLDVLRCDCGRPLGHIGRCKFIAIRTAVARQQRWDMLVQYFHELRVAILDSAAAFGADEELSGAGLILAAGMFTRNREELVHLTGTKPSLVFKASERYISQSIWSADGTVYLGIDDSAPVDCGDIGFWLAAMVGAGVTDMKEPGLFARAGSPP